MVRKHWIFLLLLSISCDQLPTTRGGVEIEFINLGNGQSAIPGEIMTLNMSYFSEDGDTLYDSRRDGQVQIMFDTAQWRNGGLLYEVLELLEVGDSVQFEIPAKNLYEVSFQQEIPENVDEDSDLSFVVGFAESASEQVMVSRRESELLDKYFAENNIAALSTESGLRYVIHEPGVGPNAQTGEIVHVHYEGTLMNGKKIDSSTDRGGPYSFYLGYGRVIKGWDEGIALLNKGAKATLYIPSSLAYGAQGAGRDVPPNSIMKFEVELVDIEKPATN